jgi:hypothetical protein
MPDPNPESMEGEKGREGGDEPVVVPIITPTTVAWIYRLFRRVRGQ